MSLCYNRQLNAGINFMIITLRSSTYKGVILFSNVCTEEKYVYAINRYAVKFQSLSKLVLRSCIA